VSEQEDEQMTTYCGYCGKPVNQQALSLGECPHCGAHIAPTGDAISSSNVLTEPDALRTGAYRPQPQAQPTIHPLNIVGRLSAALGVSGGTLATIAFFLAWITFTSTSCNEGGAHVTQSGWDILTNPKPPFYLGTLYAPILVAAVAGIVLHLMFLLLPTLRATRIAAWNFVLTFVGWASFLFFWRQILGNQLVHRVHLGFYLELTGLGLLMSGALLQVTGTMPPVPPGKGFAVSRGGLLSLALALYPVLLLAMFFFAGVSGVSLTPSGSPAAGWFFLISAVLTPIGGLLVGRRALHATAQGSGVARWGTLLSLGELATIAYVLGLISFLYLASKGVKLR